MSGCIDLFTKVNSDVTRQDITWAATADPSIKAVPHGIRHVLTWITSTYGASIPLLLSGSGLPSSSTDAVGGNNELSKMRELYINELLKGQKSCKCTVFSVYLLAPKQSLHLVTFLEVKSNYM